MNRSLASAVRKYEAVTVAVSGGVDSMTLAYAANQLLGSAATIVHAVSPAVPPAATQRVRRYAELFEWNLRIVDANEFLDKRYVVNPSNRCFFCKSNLYSSLSMLGIGNLMSGTNLDDLSDYRPGLKAASNFDVSHPFVEAKMTKSDVRQLAREFGLKDIAELPASPCLSSRIETGIAIDADTLRIVNRVEEWVSDKLAPETVRCRVQKDAIVISLDDLTFERLTEGDADQLKNEVEKLLPTRLDKTVSIGTYTKGESFLRSP